MLSGEEDNGNDQFTKNALPQDHQEDQRKELLELGLANEGEEARPVFLCTALTLESKERLLF